jgi:hypothetical protein
LEKEKKEKDAKNHVLNTNAYAYDSNGAPTVQAETTTEHKEEANQKSAIDKE